MKSGIFKLILVIFGVMFILLIPLLLISLLISSLDMKMPRIAVPILMVIVILSSTHSIYTGVKYKYTWNGIRNIYLKKNPRLFHFLFYFWIAILIMCISICLWVFLGIFARII